MDRLALEFFQRKQVSSVVSQSELRHSEILLRLPLVTRLGPLCLLFAAKTVALRGIYGDTSAMFLTTFTTVFWAVFKLVLVSAAAGILVRKRMIGQNDVRSLSSVTVNVLLPCMIFAKIVGKFDPAVFPYWWLIPLSSFGILAVGLGLALLAFCRELPEKKSMLAVASMQNAGYLVLPLGQMLYPDQFDLFALYCFLLILGVSPVLWSLGKVLSTHGASGGNGGWRSYMTPPFCANVLALLLVFTGLRRFLPSVVLDSVEMMGDATVPLATFVLGATLGGISLRKWPPVFDTVRALGIRLLIVPAIAICILAVLQLRETSPLLCDFYVIQAASAPATGLILQIRKYGGDEQTVGSLLMIGYPLCVLTMPMWLAIWHVIS